ncbi:oxidoreductase [Daejeonella lutea]|uniref:Short-chain dehydrogenase n=1 Tax=Daejeonella lutea TaxID=572036 RepID=A0A1T5BXG4_9SPHI|nr:oxidoreductase [Daejeonella lutea]SKB52048.1 Short-chain dehydrogenase [Daejeonella lutea]
MITSSRIWLITGVSGGLGRALALEAARNGDIVFGTLRQEGQVDEFSDLVHGKTFGIQLDVNNHTDIGPVLTHIIDQFGRIDVLVNNAGYGLFGAAEEVSMQEAREQMETNFFGALALTQAVLPIMRSQRSGHILQVSSIAGLSSNPGLGIYNASKFALEGFTEALYMETKDLNIKVTLIEPGPFRTDWAGSSSVRSVKVIPDYDSTAGERIRAINGMSGKQPGDPVKAAKAILKIVNSENPPLRLALGKIAIDVIRKKINLLERELNEWEKLSANTGFEE